MSDPIPFVGNTPRFTLPLLFAGQAQKEFYVNEALLRADLLLHATIEGEAQTPPSAPTAGQAWLVGDAPAGAFAGHAGAIAGWTDAGWRFVAPRDGLRIYDRSRQAFRLFAGVWRLQADVAAPSGGGTVDAEARAALVTILDRLREAGVLAAS